MDVKVIQANKANIMNLKELAQNILNEKYYLD
jgi:hypothetical protein